MLGLLTLASCSQTTKEKPVCTEFNAHCESLKPWHILQVLELRDTNSVDAYGEKLKVGDFYIRNNRTKMLFLIESPKDNTEWNISPQSLRKLQNKEGDQYCKILKNAKFDTAIVMTAGYYDFIAGIVCLKDGEANISNTSKQMLVGWINYKE